MADHVPVGSIDKQKDGSFELLICEFPARDDLEEDGYTADGLTWQALAGALLKLKTDAATRGLIGFESDEDTFVATCKQKPPLLALAKLIAAAETDRKLLRKAIAQAEIDGTLAPP